MSTTKKTLVAFDFDHTLINENSDLFILNLLPNKEVPSEIEQQYNNKNWTRYMGSIFRHLHKLNVSPEQIQACMMEIEFTNGMLELLEYLSQDHFEVIIISDSNSVFIETILKDKGVDGTIHSVYTNPASFDDEACLTIEHYHNQDWCDLSTINLCKGHILESHIAERKKAGVAFDYVAYVGDGGNDLCACLRLGKQDLAFPRKGFRLLKKLERLQNEAQNSQQVKCSIHPWETGQDILQVFENTIK